MTLLHGDAQQANSVLLDNKVLLIDMDGLTIGPKHFDLLPLMVAQMRFGGSQGRWKRFAGTYTKDDLGWLEKFAIIRETTNTTWLATRAVNDRLALSELKERIKTWDMPPGEHKPWLVL